MSESTTPSAGRMAARVTCLMVGLALVGLGIRATVLGLPATAVFFTAPGALLLGCFALLCKK